MIAAAACALSLALTGCNPDVPMNPSFPLTVADAEADLDRMAESPIAADRPIVVAGGYADPGFVPGLLSRRMRDLTDDDAVTIPAQFFLTCSFDACRDRLIDAVERAAPCDDPAWTTEVDVIGFSMGGLAARYASRARDDGGKRLRIARLFAIASPHRGARTAGLAPLDPRACDMRAGSAFLADLDESLAGEEYDLCCYVRLGDFMVGEANAAPAGDRPWWVANCPLTMAHMGAWNDPRILADIARRLRSEPPHTTYPPAPLPSDVPVSDP